VAAIGVAAVLVLALRDPALPVLGVGVACAALGLRRGRAASGAAPGVAGRGPAAPARPTLTVADLRRAVGPLSLLLLLALAVALGTLARELDPPSFTRWETAGVAAGASVFVNNLPAAALLSAHTPDHPAALLIGLNLGPNLAVTGSLSALIWWRSARALGAHPSILHYSAVGAPVAVVAMVLALIVSG
jgi:arsenical pump membrane protein